MRISFLRAPTRTSLLTRLLLRCNSIRFCKPPTYSPPMYRAGGDGGEEESWSVVAAAARAATSVSSSSMTVGWTPTVERRRFMTWHMQQAGRVKMMTGFSEMRRWMRSSGESPPLPGEEAVVSSRWTPCIGDGGCMGIGGQEDELFIELQWEK